MSQAGHMEWGKLPSSRITTVSCTWQSKKWILRLVRLVARLSQSPIGHPMDPSALGKETIYSLVSGVFGGVIH